jgi:hypothetical protein
MIDINRFAEGFAADAARTSNIQSETIQDIVRDAFRRGLQIGLALRQPEAPRPAPKSQPADLEHRPWNIVY